jgi:hypothetical protein
MTRARASTRPRHGPASRAALAALGGVMAALGALSGGCGYTVGFIAPPGASTIAVPIFHNSTLGLRREIEYELSLLVRRELQQRTELRLVDAESADLVLRGNIVEFREDLVVDENRNRKVESTLSASVDVSLEDHINLARYTRRVTTREPFSPALGETFDETSPRALQNLAERIVAAIEYWGDDADDEAAGEGEAGGALGEGAERRR